MKDASALVRRIDDLETKLAFQEDTIGSLNQLVTEQSAELTAMQEQLRWLGRKFNQLQQQTEDPNDDPAEEPPPPHY
ncbi:MAG: SlyX family protein [Pseudomonadota bacterium]